MQTHEHETATQKQQEAYKLLDIFHKIA